MLYSTLTTCWAATEAATEPEPQCEYRTCDGGGLGLTCADWPEHRGEWCSVCAGAADLAAERQEEQARDTEYECWLAEVEAADNWRRELDWEADRLAEEARALDLQTQGLDYSPHACGGPGPGGADFDRLYADRARLEEDTRKYFQREDSFRSFAEEQLRLRGARRDQTWHWASLEGQLHARLMAKKGGAA